MYHFSKCLVIFISFLMVFIEYIICYIVFNVFVSDPYPLRNMSDPLSILKAFLSGIPIIFPVSFGWGSCF